MVQTEVIALRNIQDAARQSVMAVRNFVGINFDGLAFPDKRHLILLRRGRELCFFNIWILAAHALPLLSQRAHHEIRTVERPTAQLSSRAKPAARLPAGLYVVQPLAFERRLQRA